MSYRSSSSSFNAHSSTPCPPSFGIGNGSSRRLSVSGNNVSSRKSSASVSPVCVHCRNLGLKHDHWLRKSPEPDSPVVCPVLLETECRYCHEFGHTVAGCPSKKRSMARQHASAYIGSMPSHSVISRTLTPTVVAPALTAVRLKNGYSAFDTDSSSDSGSDTFSVSSLKSNNSKKRVDVGSLFASSKKENIVGSSNVKRVDVGSLFSPVPVSVVESRSCTSMYTQFTYKPPNVVSPEILQTELGEDGLHEKEYDWSTYGDPEVDRIVAELRTLFASGKSWADICYDDE